jgi:hypothetical protein
MASLAIRSIEFIVGGQLSDRFNQGAARAGAADLAGT